LLGPVEGALAGFAEFFFVRGGAVGFWFAVGHEISEFDGLRPTLLWFTSGSRVRAIAYCAVGAGFRREPLIRS
jgi:hypothetical protein